MGEGMTEAQLRELVQQTSVVGIVFAVVATLAIYLATPSEEGGPRRWYVWRDRILAWLPPIERRPEPADAWYDEDEGADKADSASGRQTDRQTDRGVSASSPLFAAALGLEVDRSRKGVVKALVAAGWGVGEIRAILKGDNAAIGAEVREVQEAIGLPPPPREVEVHGQIEAKVELPARR